MNAPSCSPSAADAPPSAHAKFVHLKVHSAYSLLEGALPIPKLAKLAAAHELPALGLTDTNNLFGALEFSDKLAEAGIQPIIGVALNVDFAERKQEPIEQGGAAAAAAPRGGRADRAVCGERGRLRQHDEAREPGTFGSRRDRCGAHYDRCARGPRRGADRAHRRSRRAHRPRVAGRPAAARR